MCRIGSVFSALCYNLSALPNISKIRPFVISWSTANLRLAGGATTVLMKDIGWTVLAKMLARTS